MPNAEEVPRQIAVHEAVCAEGWKQTNTRLSRIEIVLGVLSSYCSSARGR